MNTTTYARILTLALEGDRGAAKEALLEARRRMHKADVLAMWISAYGPVTGQGRVDWTGLEPQLARDLNELHDRLLISSGPFFNSMSITPILGQLMSDGIVVVRRPTAERGTFQTFDIAPVVRASPFAEVSA